MIDLLKTVRDLKTKAKNRRDDGLFQQGVDFAQEAIALLERELADASSQEWRSQVAAELADCYGIIGGIQRRWGLALDGKERLLHLEASRDAYEKGYGCEREENCGVVNSYNLVNRLVGRVLLDPAIELDEDLRQAKDIVKAQLVQKRKGDIWALADMALLRILLREADAVSAWAAFRGAQPPDYAYGSVLETLQPLAELELPVRAELASSIELLKADWDEL